MFLCLSLVFVTFFGCDNVVGSNVYLGPTFFVNYGFIVWLICQHNPLSVCFKTHKCPAKIYKKPSNNCGANKKKQIIIYLEKLSKICREKIEWKKQRQNTNLIVLCFDGNAVGIQKIEGLSVMHTECFTAVYMRCICWNSISRTKHTLLDELHATKAKIFAWVTFTSFNQFLHDLLSL